MKASSQGSAGSTTDGRVRRGERSRDQIVSALLELIGSGQLQPTAQQVADRAGVGIRSVFRHFCEMETLYAEMDARLEVEAVAIMGGDVDRGGALVDRVRRLVRRRARMFERIAPFKRAGKLQRWRSPFLQARHARMQRTLRTDLRQWLPELERADKELTEAVELATSFEAWDRLRYDRRLSEPQSVAVVERTVVALSRDLHPAGRKLR